MPINFSEPPATAHDVLQSVLPVLLNEEAVRVHLLNEQVEEANDVEYSYTMPVFNIGVATLADGALLDNLELIGWRHLLVDRGNPIAYIDLDAEATQVIKITQGKFTQLILDALTAVDELEESNHLDYAVRYIEIHALYFAALWLHNPDVEDLIMPLEDHHHDGGLNAMTVYAEADILRLLQQKRPHRPLSF